ncbi:MAG: hypothetical protein IJ636_03515 [Bacteroidales bacterium]|nr:hypothetical protein [Bacteroidales bacterium]
MEELDEEMIQFEKDHPSKKPGAGASGNGGTMRILAIALAAVAVALLAALIIMMSKKNTLVKDLNIDKQNLTNELVALQSDYESISTTNAAINDSLNVEKEKVGQLIERLQKTEATNRAKIREYEKELGTLRSIMKGYIKQIDSLNTLNISLRNEATAARREAQESKKQYEDLRTTTEQLSQKASAGAVVKGRGFNLVAIGETNKVTDRSSRARKLRACLSLIENSIAERGYRTVYIRVKGPDGVLMTDDSGKVFTCGGEQMIYSASREVDYQGDEVEICIYFAASQGFEKGKYTVDLYTDETRLGTAEMILK